MEKRDLLKDRIFYGMLSIFVFFNTDLSTMRLLAVGGMNVYCGDIFFFLVLATAVWAFIKKEKGWRWTQPVTTWYLLFLAWLALAVIWGWRIYGYRAFGESRYILPFFAFFIPYILLADKRSDNPALVGKYVRMTTYVAAAASLLFLICSLVYRKPFYFSEIHLKNQKLWVHKIISSDQSFHIILLAMFIFYLSFFRKRFFTLPKMILFLLLIIALPVHNRTALISLFFVFLFLLVLGKRPKEMLFACTSVVVIFALLKIVPAIERFYYPIQSRQQASRLSRQQAPRLSRQQAPDLNVKGIKGMSTGYWRFYLNKAALRQVLQKPVFGWHLGGYFDFFIPEKNQKISLPPHNQYILILLKTGMIGLVLLLVPLFLLLRRLYKFLVDERLETSERSIVWLLLLILLAQFPYGMGFGFIPLFAIYFGLGSILLESLAKKYPPQLRIKKD
ncbi:MAG: O-antigen ligase family protein [Candidatus Aminicenantes bacterium]|nr:O-antigen ligase family protein [Acidobacteriota bacterium]MCG2811117.1 O-antigen ligase family protein [Candidatus Aminicenantes bacterium]